ncbi:MAG: ATP synthase F1 subunit delta [Planctomycetes bacterium]|nr:ATP synthase F1 subunit delta [Planctomycetota bacterium]
MSLAAAKRYAEALFELAHEKKALGPVADGLLSLRQRLADDAALRQAFFDPKGSIESKKTLVDGKLGQGLHQYVVHLVKLLCDRRREGGLMTLILHFFELKEAADGIVQVLVESALPMDEEARSALAERLSKATGKKVQLELQVVPDLIGGLRLTVGSTRIDGTVKRRYEDLAQRLKAAV